MTESGNRQLPVWQESILLVVTALLMAVIVKGYPRLSETFIAQELAALERRGLEELALRRELAALREAA